MDIALLRLSASITDVEPLEPRLDQPPLELEHFTAVGYGNTSDDGRGSGTRRFREELTTELIGPYYAAGHFLVISEKEWSGDEGICSGDSGGPALDLAGQVFGVVSRGAPGCLQPTYTRTDSWADWIRERAAEAAGYGEYPTPAWVTPPVTDSVAFGGTCRSDEQCQGDTLCLIIEGRRRCTTDDCGACPEGWMCGQTAAGTDACVPDPSYVPPVVDAGMPPVGDVPSVPEGGAADAARPATTTGHSTCSATPGTPSGLRALVLVALAALAGAVRRRR
jgi:MYXO-CTERM domain-containing protein